MYEAQKAYLYLVDGRGQTFTDVAGLTEKLAEPELSVSSANYTVVRCMPDGERVDVVPPILEPTGGPGWRPSYWIPRQNLIRLLSSALPSNVHTKYGCNVREVTRTADGGLEVEYAEGETMTRVQPSVLVGADGLKSVCTQGLTTLRANMALLLAPCSPCPCLPSPCLPSPCLPHALCTDCPTFCALVRKALLCADGAPSGARMMHRWVRPLRTLRQWSCHHPPRD